jgi:nucleotide-binding universal stress UspA family protein
MTAKAQKMLVCYDGSEPARRALDKAAELMGYGSLLAVANVAPRGEPSGSIALSEARERLLRRQLTASYVPLQGDPVEELVATAQALDVDLVVLGVAGAGRGSRSDTPHVGSELVRRAPCDVLVVR